MSTNKLRLGPLPKNETIKLTVSLSVELKQRLERYAQLHSQVHGDLIDAATLIPHILEAFVARDREFTKYIRRSDNLSMTSKPDPLGPELGGIQHRVDI